MTEEGITEEGRQRIAMFVKAWIGWSGRDAIKRLTSTERIGKTTIMRAQRGEDLSETAYRALGDVMELPRDFLLYIGYGQIEHILSSTDDADLIRWTTDHLFPPAGGDEDGLAAWQLRRNGTTGE